MVLSNPFCALPCKIECCFLMQLKYVLTYLANLYIQHSTLLGQFFVQKTRKKKHFEEKKINECLVRFFFISKDPITSSVVHIYK